MIHLPASVRVYLCLTPCDMRKSFDGLMGLVREYGRSYTRKEVVRPTFPSVDQPQAYDS